jgi:hypothetical protein
MPISWAPSSGGGGGTRSQCTIATETRLRSRPRSRLLAETQRPFTRQPQMSRYVAYYVDSILLSIF